MQHPAAQPPHRARLELVAGKLSVSADNSSLNQILRDIARLTGMKITGGVADERVFGTYGPSDISAVLTALLNGTGSNMLLIEDARQSPQELVLTARQGGPTPPNPNAAPRETDEEVDLPPELTPRAPTQPATTPTPNPFNTPPPAVPSNATIPLPNGAVPTPGTTTQESPNGVKTPQQIYDQLMKLQQQAKPPSSN